MYAENNVIYAGTKTGIFKSIDNGNSWRAVNNGLLLTQCNTISGNGTSLIAGIGSEFFGGGLYFSRMEVAPGIQIIMAFTHNL